MFNINQGLKVKKLNINNFKIFKDFKINFSDTNGDPLPLIVIAGINGTGKTTILESLFDKKQLNPTIWGGGSYYSVKYEKSNQKNEIHCILNGINIIIKNYSINSAPDINTIKKDEKLFLNSHIHYLSVENDTIIKNLAEEIPKYIEKLLFEQDIVASKVYQELSKWIIDIFEDMELSIMFDKMDKNKNLYFRNTKGDSFSINDISTGEKTLLKNILYLHISDIKDSVILIDEPELSLHPSWQNKIFKLYEKFAVKNNCQIIIATHSPQIIGSAKPESLRILNKRKDGKIEVIDNYSKSYGLEVNKILLDIMGMSETRTPAVDKEIKYIKEQIYTNNFFDNEEFKNKWADLEKALGKDDLDLKLLKLEMKMREKRNVSNQQK